MGAVQPRPPKSRKVQLFRNKWTEPSLEAKQRIACKAAGMLQRALRTRLLHMIDPSVGIRKIYEHLMKVPDVERLAPIYISGGKFDLLNRLASVMKRKLRTVRDLIDDASEKADWIELYSAGLLPTSNGLKIPTLAKLMSDVHALDKNFAKLIVGPSLISVVTDDIVLHCESACEDVNLGPMRITLKLLHYCRGDDCENPYVIEAVNPVYPKNGDSYIHPHVQGGILCEGDATEAIKNALDEGRIHDFFHIVHNTLIVYNEDSPHRELTLWLHESVTCPECGDDMSSDYSSHCEICGETYCDNCTCYCDESCISICDSCRRNTSECGFCDKAGCADCVLHQNAPCMICDEPPCDNEEVLCDSGYTMHDDCIAGADSIPTECIECSNMDRCDYLPDHLKEKEEDDEDEN